MPRLRGSHRATVAGGASIDTSTANDQPCDRCSSRVRSASSPAGGVNVPGSGSAATIRSTRSTRRADRVCDQHSRYQRLCRSTTAHGSTSISRSEKPRSKGSRYVSRSRRVVAHDSISAVVSSGLTRAASSVSWAGAASLIERTSVDTRGGSTRMILASAAPTRSAGSAAGRCASSTAITRPDASAAVNVSGGSRIPCPTW